MTNDTSVAHGVAQSLSWVATPSVSRDNDEPGAASRPSRRSPSMTGNVVRRPPVPDEAHCPYCHDEPTLRRRDHCIECGRANVDLVDDECCGSCRDWLAGDRTFTDDTDVMTALYAAIVERARADLSRPQGFAVQCWCGESVDHCSRGFLAVLQLAVERADGDPSIAMHLVADIAA